jgi:hypothetical protein
MLGRIRKQHSLGVLDMKGPREDVNCCTIKSELSTGLHALGYLGLVLDKPMDSSNLRRYVSEKNSFLLDLLYDEEVR